jgi:hypothetical protein
MKQSPLLEANSCSDALYVQKSMLKVPFPRRMNPVHAIKIHFTFNVTSVPNAQSSLFPTTLQLKSYALKEYL